jgi:hypothetical protein
MARKHSRRHRRGGAGAPDPSSYSSAATYQMAVNGSENSQYNRVMDQSGPDGRNPSNAIVGIQGQRAGGRRRSKKGGFWGQIINQAIVPFGILGMQQTYRRKRQGGRRTRRHH